jgi:hypothetical protein
MTGIVILSLPLGCKAVVYEDGDTRGLWASRGVGGWYLGPSMDHYRFDIYYIPETWAYRISRSTEIFPQHCQLPGMTPYQHLHALTDELTDDATEATHTLQLLRDKITTMLAPPPTLEEQRVANNNIILQQEAEQRVIDDSPILTIKRITNAPGIIESRNPMAIQALKTTPHIHKRLTRNNTPGIMPAVIAPATYMSIPTCARQRLVTQHVLNALTCYKRNHINLAFTPTALLPPVVKNAPLHIKHFALPMVHPVTGETISSNKKLMHDPATAEIWQTAFGKDFGGMAQGDLKMGQKGTNALFVMTHDKIRHVLRQGKKSLTRNLWSIIGRKKKIHTGFELLPGVISSRTSPAHPYAQQTLTLLNSTGTVSSARLAQNTCAWISKKII